MTMSYLRLSLLTLSLTVVAIAFGQRNAAYEAYIAEYRNLAEEHEVLYGIPASITLAQAILESQAGQSELARLAKNHFGIKCTNDWSGDCYLHDDNKPEEQFRVYQSASQSYRDHALFLRRDRYKSCFAIPVSDYRGWANQLKTCGYATDVNYANKLVKLIEDYDLAKAAVLSEPMVETTVAAAVGTQVALSAEADTNLDTRADRDDAEPIVVLTVSEEKRLFRQTHYRGEEESGARYYIAKPGDTYATVAYSLNLKERDLRKWNNALGRRLHVGDHIFYSQAESNKEKRYQRKLAKAQEKALQLQK